MKIALFVDVDLTLTVDHIQAGIAKHLGCLNEYAAIERQLQDGTIDSEGFGYKIVKLFRERNLRRGQIEKIFKSHDHIVLREGAKQLLTIPGVDVYIVSTGPNYYLQLLAKEFGIPLERMHCSVYAFEKDGDEVVTSCEKAATATSKCDFVQKHAPRYAISVGIGDSQRDDAFVDRCTIGLLVARAPSQLLNDDAGLPTPEMRSRIDTSDAVVIRRLTTAVRVASKLKEVRAREQPFARSIWFALGLLIAAIATLYATGKLPTSVISAQLAKAAHTLAIALTVVLIPLALGVIANWIYERLRRRKALT
jgi:phosphoserine phosphatase